MARIQDIFSAQLLAPFRDDPLVIIDLGARGSLDADMLALAPIASVIGFEPDAEEARRLAAAPPGPWKSQKVLPYAIAGKKGPATLHAPREPEGASLLKHNEAMIEEFGHEGLHRTLRTFAIEALTLDDIKSGSGGNHVDYLKIDIEGAELAVLQGGQRLAATAKVMKIECAFLEQRNGQPLAADVIRYLADHGFDLIDIRAITWWRRRPLPSHPYNVAFSFPYSRGRIAQADFYFVRRFEANASGRDVASAMLILSAIGHIDLAMTLLRRCPAADAFFRTHGADAERDLQRASAAMGKSELMKATVQQLRGLIPLLRSKLGRLPFRQPEKPY